MRFLSRGARFSAKRRRAAQGHKDAQHGKTRTGLPEGVAHRAHEGAGGDHEQTVGHAVHADEGGSLVTGNGVVQLLAFMQKVHFQCALHQHHAEQTAPRGGKAHQQRADAAEQGADGVKPPHGAEPDPAAHFSAQHTGSTAQQQGKKEELCGPAQLNEPLLQEHFGQVAGHRDDGAGNDELGRQRRGAQDAQAVARQFGRAARGGSAFPGWPVPW